MTSGALGVARFPAAKYVPLKWPCLGLCIKIIKGVSLIRIGTCVQNHKQGFMKLRYVLGAP